MLLLNPCFVSLFFYSRLDKTGLTRVDRSPSFMVDTFWGGGENGEVYPFFQPIEGIWKKGTRVLQHASNSRLTRWYHAHRPCRARRLLFFYSETVWGLTEPWRLRILTSTPLSRQFGGGDGGVSSRISAKYVLYSTPF